MCSMPLCVAAAQPGMQRVDAFIDDLFVRHVTRPDRDVALR